MKRFVKILVLMFVLFSFIFASSSEEANGIKKLVPYEISLSNDNYLEIERVELPNDLSLLPLKVRSIFLDFTTGEPVKIFKAFSEKVRLREIYYEQYYYFGFAKGKHVYLTYTIIKGEIAKVMVSEVGVRGLLIEYSDAGNIASEFKWNIVKGNPTVSYTGSYPHPVKTYLLVDDEFRINAESSGRYPSWVEAAIDYFERADDPFESKFGIDFYIAYLDGSWESPDGISDPYVLWDKAKQYVGWDRYGTTDNYYDVLAIFIEQNVTLSGIGGIAELLGNDFIAVTYGSPPVNIIQHEESHLFGAHDHGGWEGLSKWCVMSYTWWWATRDWCSSCFNTIKSNSGRFDGYP